MVTRVDDAVLAGIEAVRDAGFTSIKIFTAVPGFQLDDESILAVLQRAAETGVLVNIRAEDGALIDHLTRLLLRDDRREMDALPVARPDLAEGLATEKVAIYGGATRCPIYVVHLSSHAALESVRRARARGAEIYVETRPLYLFLTEESYCLPGEEARKYVAWPPLRKAADREALWDALARGEIQTYATDHTTWTLAQKTDPSLTFADVPGGVSNVESFVGMLYSAGVRDGRISLSRFVEVVATNPAKLFGLWPRKGTIAVGSDADLTIIDPERRMRIESAADAVELGLRPVRGPRGRRLACHDDRPRPRGRRPWPPRRRPRKRRAAAPRHVQPALTVPSPPARSGREATLDTPPRARSPTAEGRATHRRSPSGFFAQGGRRLATSHPRGAEGGCLAVVRRMAVVNEMRAVPDDSAELVY